MASVTSSCETESLAPAATAIVAAPGGELPRLPATTSCVGDNEQKSRRSSSAAAGDQPSLPRRGTAFGKEGAAVPVGMAAGATAGEWPDEAELMQEQVRADAVASRGVQSAGAGGEALSPRSDILGLMLLGEAAPETRAESPKSRGEASDHDDTMTEA